VLLRHLGQSPIEALPARALADGFPSLAFPTSRLEIETCFDHRRYLGAFHMVDEAQLSLLLEPPSLPPQGAHGFRAQNRVDTIHPPVERDVGRRDHFPEDPSVPP